MKIEGKPIIAMEARLTLDHHELSMLHKLCSYGIAVVAPIIGKDADSAVKEPWEAFIQTMRTTTVTVLNRFYQANEVFEGRKKIE